MHRAMMCRLGLFMNKRIFLFISIILAGNCHFFFGMVYDNRYIFLAQRPFISTPDRPSHLIADIVIQTASKAIGSNEKEIPLCELFGEFDQGKMARAFTLIGQENPFVSLGRPEWQDGTFLWAVPGNIQTQGVSFAYHQAIFDWLSCGATWLAMRAHTRCEFFLKENSIPMTVAEKRQLDEIRRIMLQNVGITGNKSTQSGFGDFDFYLRFGYAWDYVIKLRRIESGLRLGLLVPTGVKKENNVILSIPFGGNGHYGVYAELDAEVELKEDCKVGGLMRLSKRLGHTLCYRVPVKDETPLFGLLIAPLLVHPGLTSAFSSYLILENLREGFGVRLQYTLLHHGKDHLCDRRSIECQQNKPIVLDELIRYSHWSSDYITVAAFYDFGKMKSDAGFSPILTLSWDIPSLLIVANRVVKSHRIILGLEFSF
jgi:hypothetical protein